MRKAVLEGNILPKAKQRLLIDGFPSSDIIYISRDVIEMSIGVIELPDQTKVPGGRKRAGEFTTQLQFARDNDRNAYLKWFNQCIDQGGRIAGKDNGDIVGIDANYKKSGTIIYYRLWTGSASAGNLSGSKSSPVRARIYGLWPSSLKLPDYDMNSDESDGDCQLEVTLQFDDVEIKSEGGALAGMTGGLLGG